MTEALVESGLGATRALVLDGETVIEAHLERDDAGLLPGTIAPARIRKLLEPGRRAIVVIGQSEALLEPLPPRVEGAALMVEVVRAALPESGRPRLPKVRLSEGPACAGPPLVRRLPAAGHRVTLLGPHEGARLDAAGWGEIVEQAQTGFVPFDGGMLTISPTPAMTVIDVDGAGDLQVLAVAAARAAAAAIRCFGVTGSIGIDFPSLSGKAARAAIDTLLDAALPQPFEKTAINGFGFVQIVRPRRFASLVEQVRAPGFAALELLRRATGHVGTATLTAHPQVTAWLRGRPGLIDGLARRIGGTVTLADDPLRPISAGDVH